MTGLLPACWWVRPVPWLVMAHWWVELGPEVASWGASKILEWGSRPGVPEVVLVGRTRSLCS